MIDNIDEVRIKDFLMSLSNELDNDILELKKHALNLNVPIIRDETKDFLKLILNLVKPKTILEIGTGIAYSTLVFHKTCPNSYILTIENYEERIKEAKVSIDRYFKKDAVRLFEVDASDYFTSIKMDEKFDFIFLDAAKGQYISWLPYIKDLLNDKAILVADNIFKDGEILESKYLIKKRDRTIHKRMRDFLYSIENDKELDTYIFSIGDGLSVSIKK